ncbi:hypothetical protein [Streptomyces sp. SM12]|uniref:hypothetical protein n=1 Tax=Streptomyces sp. SM12 TaxID=1071602 RepID=UPI0011AFFC58|nr:hypothetical protein [Streptomyces sp. SM12]
MTTNTTNTGGDVPVLATCGAPYCGGNGRFCVLPPHGEDTDHQAATGQRWPVAGHPTGHTPGGVDDERDQRVDELCDALRYAIRHLSYSAGREVADAPRQAELMLAAAQHLTDVLSGTTGAGAAVPDDDVAPLDLTRLVRGLLSGGEEDVAAELEWTAVPAGLVDRLRGVLEARLPELEARPDTADLALELGAVAQQWQRATPGGVAR